jgi:aldehyde:ferredoxin oxidoreductase
MDGLVQSNRLGLDTYEFSRMLDFLKDLYQAGLWESHPPLLMEKLGSREFINRLIESVAYRQGIGDLLAEGVARTADQIKDGWEFCAKYFPAYGSASHGVMRTHPGVALLWALDSRDPIIDQHAYLKLAVSHPGDPPPYGLPLDRAKLISRKLFGSEMAIDHSNFTHKAEMTVYAQNKAAVINLLVVCDWIYPIFSSHGTEDRLGDTSLESRLLTAVSGYDLTEKELDRIGERVWNLARALMVREGRTREQDTFHESYFREHGGEKAIPLTDFEEAKTRYYQLRGWDEKTGWPTRQKLQELGLL